MATGTSKRSATARQVSMAAGRGAPVLVELEAADAGRDLLLQRSGIAGVALCPAVPQLTGSGSAASNMRAMFHGPGVQVVALVPSAGPVPPADHGGDAVGQGRDIPAAGRSCGCGNPPPPGVAIRCSPAITSVPGLPTTMSDAHRPSRLGFPDLPTATIRPWRTPMSGLDDSKTGSMMMALVMTISSAPPALVISEAWPMPSRADLPPPENQLVAVGQQVAFNLTDQGRVGQTEPVSRGGAVEFDVLPSADSGHAMPSSLVKDDVSDGWSRKLRRLIASKAASRTAGESRLPSVRPLRPRARRGSSDCDQRHILAVAGLEADGSAGGHIQPQSRTRPPGRTATRGSPRRSGSETPLEWLGLRCSRPTQCVWDGRRLSRLVRRR